MAEFEGASGLRVEIQGSLDGECHIGVFIGAEATTEPDADGIPFLAQLRTALQPANEQEQPHRLVRLPNVYGLPMVELVFPEPVAEKPAPEAPSDDPHPEEPKEAIGQ